MKMSVIVYYLIVTISFSYSRDSRIHKRHGNIIKIYPYKKNNKDNIRHTEKIIKSHMQPWRNKTARKSAYYKQASLDTLNKIKSRKNLMKYVGPSVYFRALREDTGSNINWFDWFLSYFQEAIEKIPDKSPITDYELHYPTTSTNKPQERLESYDEKKVVEALDDPTKTQFVLLQKCVAMHYGDASAATGCYFENGNLTEFKKQIKVSLAKQTKLVLPQLPFFRCVVFIDSRERTERIKSKQQACLEIEGTMKGIKDEIEEKFGRDGLKLFGFETCLRDSKGRDEESRLLDCAVLFKAHLHDATATYLWSKHIDRIEQEKHSKKGDAGNESLRYKHYRI